LFDFLNYYKNVILHLNVAKLLALIFWKSAKNRSKTGFFWRFSSEKQKLQQKQRLNVIWEFLDFKQTR